MTTRPEDIATARKEPDAPEKAEPFTAGQWVVWKAAHKPKDLTVGKAYRVLAFNYGMHVNVIADDGEETTYLAECFRPATPAEVERAEKPKLCQQRVWDGNGGDMTSCDKPVTANARCAEHQPAPSPPDAVAELRVRVAQLEASVDRSANVAAQTAGAVADHAGQLEALEAKLRELTGENVELGPGVLPPRWQRVSYFEREDGVSVYEGQVDWRCSPALDGYRSPLSAIAALDAERPFPFVNPYECEFCGTQVENYGRHLPAVLAGNERDAAIKRAEAAEAEVRRLYDEVARKNGYIVEHEQATAEAKAESARLANERDKLAAELERYKQRADVAEAESEAAKARAKFWAGDADALIDKYAALVEAFTTAREMSAQIISSTHGTYRRVEIEAWKALVSAFDALEQPPSADAATVPEDALKQAAHNLIRAVDENIDDVRSDGSFMGEDIIRKAAQVLREVLYPETGWRASADAAGGELPAGWSNVDDLCYVRDDDPKNVYVQGGDDWNGYWPGWTEPHTQILPGEPFATALEAMAAVDAAYPRKVEQPEPAELTLTRVAKAVCEAGCGEYWDTAVGVIDRYAKRQLADCDRAIADLRAKAGSAAADAVKRVMDRCATENVRFGVDSKTMAVLRDVERELREGAKP